MYSCAGEWDAVLVLCDVQCFMAIYVLTTVSIITWGLDKYGHFNDVILNWHQVYSIGGATHIHNLNNCPRAKAFLCKKAEHLHINIKVVQTA